MPVRFVRRRNPRVAVRMKVRRQRVRSALGVIIALAVVVFAIWTGTRFYSVAKTLLSQAKRPSWSYWRAKGVKVSGLSNREVAALVAEHSRPQTGKVYFSSDCVKIQSDLKEQFPYLRDISVSRNWLNGKMVVAAVARKPIGLLLAADGHPSSYIDDNGELYSISGSTDAGNVLAVVLSSAPASGRVSRELTALLSYMDGNREQFPSMPVELRSAGRGGELTVRLEDGSLVEWGNFAYAKEKLEKLRAIFGIAKSRIAGPLRVNMLNFEDGSIPVSALVSAGH